MFTRFSLLLYLCSALLALQAQVQYVLPSKNLPTPDTVWVFKPANYQSSVNKQYPLVYLLHGWSGSYHQWNDIYNCQELADRYGFIIVCPDGLYNSWYINSPAQKSNQYSDFFFQDLMPFITNQYRVDTTNMFISGLSMGGHGALYLFEQKPNLFKSAGSLSGVMDLSFCWEEYGIKDLMGITEKNLELLSTYSVIGNVDKIRPTGKEIIVSCGTSDRFFGLNKAFKKRCDELKIPITYVTSPGGHNYAYWGSAIGLQFAFFENQVKKQGKK